MQYKVDVVLLTYKPDKQVFKLINALEQQTYPVNKIIIMNTEEKYFNKLFYGTGFLEKYKNIEVHHISAKEFDHGRTRKRAIQYSDSDIFVCMTHDAIPKDNTLIENLVKGLISHENIAVAYARQLPLQDCREIEKYTRSFNYPDESQIKSYSDIDKMGIKTFFCSNVCAAYNRNIYDHVGGFVKRAIFNEDMIFAAEAIKSGYKILYEAKAEVLHSHNYKCMQQFRRNFDLGVSQAEHPEIFKDISSENEGIKLVKNTIKHLKKTKHMSLIPYLIVSSGCKFLGYKFGINYKKLPYGIIKWCSSNKVYWNR